MFQYNWVTEIYSVLYERDVIVNVDMRKNILIIKP